MLPQRDVNATRRYWMLIHEWKPPYKANGGYVSGMFDDPSDSRSLFLDRKCSG